MKIGLYHLPVQLPPARAPRGPAINIMPVGLLALAHRLEQDGHAVEVVHAGVEARMTEGFDVVADIEASAPDLLGFALHWHHQLGPVGEAIERLHRVRPKLPIVLGGMTASAFAEDILKHWPGVRAVVCGEAEQPLSELARRLERGDAPLHGLPNLVSRDAHGEAQREPCHYVADQAAFDALEFCRLDLLRHGEHYNAQFARSAAGWNHAPLFYLGIGRGCTVDCLFCSGGRSGHRRLAGRRSVVFRSVARVLNDLEQLARHGIDTYAICFDPPGPSAPYYQELFAAIAATSRRPALVFECYQPPTPAFIEAFAATFRRAGSRLTFSPTVGDETLRSRLLGVRYGNKDLELALTNCHRLGLQTTLYFATLPQESRAQLDESLQWQRRLVDRFGCRIIHAPIEIEPQAPWTRRPETHGLTQLRQGFTAFERRHRIEATHGVSYRDEVGYAFEDVDARVIRVSSALSDPRAWLATAMATCGLGVPETIALVAPGHQEAAWPLLEPRRAQPLVLLLASEQPCPPWEGLSELARRLGPNVKRLLFAPGLIRHQRWNGAVNSVAAGTESVRVLHFSGATAVERAWRTKLEDLPPGVVVGELCRWATAPCPARSLNLLALGRDQSLRCCPSAPDLGSAGLADIAADQRRRHAALSKARGCQDCPLAGSCSQCLFPGQLSATQFCALRRSLGPQGWPDAGRLLTRWARAGGIDIGWDG